MSMARIPLCVIFVVLVTVALNYHAVAQTTVVVPNSLTNVEGNTQNSFPFSCNPGIFPNGMRYQQAYLNSQLTRTPIEITAMNFRSTEDQSEDPPVVIPQIEISMSTTQAVPGALSATFAENLGPVVTQIFSGPLSVSTPQCGAGPCPFSVRVPFQTPYIYDPRDGNLIFEVRLPNCTLTFVALDASDTSENLAKTSRATTGNLGGVDSETAQFVDDTGLVTQFEFNVLPAVRNVPTLSEWGLMAMAGILGLIGLFAIRRKKASV